MIKIQTRMIFKIKRRIRIPIEALVTESQGRIARVADSKDL